MRPNEATIEKEGVLTGERVGMTIDTDSFAHIMSVLTNLYSDPELAILREYSTNALDSHIEAGQTRPIEVTLPGDLSPFLRVRDFGIGLDAEGIRDIYSRYGTSTKRDSDDVVGMLGLGCKSALTYCDQFTLVGRKDGVMTTVAVGRDEDGGGTMTIVDTAPTDEDNGLEVVIPAKRQNYLRDKAAAFFGWWKPGTVLVNGKQPEAHPLTWIVDGRIALSTRSQGVESHGVVMGNVFYPLSAEQAEGLVKLRNHTYAVFFVGMGEVNFTPSRESLQSTRRTRETLAALMPELEREYHDGLVRSIAEAETHRDALAAWYTARELGLPKAKAIWRGEPVLEELNRLHLANAKAGQFIDPADYTCSYLVADRNGGRTRRKTGERNWRIAPEVMARAWSEGSYINTYQSETLVFTGFTGKEVTNVKREKIDAYLTAADPDRGNRNERWVCIDKLTADEKRAWAASATIIPWAEVEAVKLTGPRASKKVRGSYPGVVPGVGPTRELAASDIDPDKVVWINGSHWHARPQTYLSYGIPDDYYLVALSANRIEKFQRDFPKAVNVRDFARKKAEAAWAKVPAAERMALAAAQLRTPHWLSTPGLDATALDDPRIAELLAILDGPKSKEGQTAMAQYTTHVPNAEVPQRKEVMQKIESLAKSYPLLPASGYGTVPKEHIIMYVNAAYAAERS